MPPASPSIEQWQMATVMSVRPETDRAKTFQLRLPRPSSYLAGQHYVVRLTAPDGYTASRSYSIVSAPDGASEIEITAERIPKSEVSMFLDNEVRQGDELEVRGPIGGWFVWPGDTPALLLGGGRSSVMSLIAMLRLARRSGTSEPIRLVLCVGNPESLYYGDELRGPETTIAYERRPPASYSRPPGRLTASDIPAMPEGTVTYISGPSSFADRATDLVLRTGTPAEQIRVERLSPWGSH